MKGGGIFGAFSGIFGTLSSLNPSLVLLKITSATYYKYCQCFFLLSSPPKINPTEAFEWQQIQENKFFDDIDKLKM